MKTNMQKGTTHMTMGLKVKRRSGEAFRKALVELGTFDRRMKIFSDGSNVYLPICGLDDEARSRLSGIGEFEILDRDFQEERANISAEDILGYRPSFEVVGDIAIIEPGGEAEPGCEEKIADAIISTQKSIRCVIVPISDVEGEFRTRRFRTVAGEKRTATSHKEHGLRYKVDLEGAYFTPRLGTERLRVAEQIDPSDTVLDMFAGVGPFALLMAHKGAKVIAIDKNPVAISCLRENALRNKIQNIEILEGDAIEIAGRYRDVADHVIMNLPHSAHLFLVPAINAAKHGGTIHYYSISPEEDLFRDQERIEKAASSMGIEIDVAYRGIVRSYAPRRYNVVIDFRVIKG